ncbi:uncharacterized protein VTP21DRAFT_11241 [Calcarisporiella thermophila]|uniref:uncharacterized protein n=1 Tax=Calcarisporiella thermophila TaxID=911321 RepID=UPI003743F2CA
MKLFIGISLALLSFSALSYGAPHAHARNELQPNHHHPISHAHHGHKFIHGKMRKIANNPSKKKNTKPNPKSKNKGKHKGKKRVATKGKTKPALKQETDMKTILSQEEQQKLAINSMENLPMTDKTRMELRDAVARLAKAMEDIKKENGQNQTFVLKKQQAQQNSSSTPLKQPQTQFPVPFKGQSLPTTLSAPLKKEPNQQVTSKIPVNKTQNNQVKLPLKKSQPKGTIDPKEAPRKKEDHQASVKNSKVPANKPATTKPAKPYTEKIKKVLPIQPRPIESKANAGTGAPNIWGSDCVCGLDRMHPNRQVASWTKRDCVCRTPPVKEEQYSPPRIRIPDIDPDFDDYDDDDDDYSFWKRGEDEGSIYYTDGNGICYQTFGGQHIKRDASKCRQVVRVWPEAHSAGDATNANPVTTLHRRQRDRWMDYREATLDEEDERRDRIKEASIDHRDKVLEYNDKANDKADERNDRLRETTFDVMDIVGDEGEEATDRNREESNEHRDRVLDEKERIKDDLDDYGYVRPNPNAKWAPLYRAKLGEKNVQEISKENAPAETKKEFDTKSVEKVLKVNPDEIAHPSISTESPQRAATEAKAQHPIKNGKEPQKMTGGEGVHHHLETPQRTMEDEESHERSAERERLAHKTLEDLDDDIVWSMKKDILDKSM